MLNRQINLHRYKSPLKTLSNITIKAQEWQVERSALANTHTLYGYKPTKECTGTTVADFQQLSPVSVGLYPKRRSRRPSCSYSGHTSCASLLPHRFLLSLHEAFPSQTGISPEERTPVPWRKSTSSVFTAFPDQEMAQVSQVLGDSTLILATI